MPVQQTIPFEEGTFFITFTCHKWMNLVETTLWSCLSAYVGVPVLIPDLICQLNELLF